MSGPFQRIDSITPPRRPPKIAFLIAAAVILFIFGRSICGLFIDYQWWSEMGQVPTWIRMGTYRYATNFAEWLVVFVIVMVCHARGIHYAGIDLRGYKAYRRLSTLALALLSLLIMSASLDGWTVARFVAGSGVESKWTDPVFGKSLSFYFFELPFYNKLIGFLAACFAFGAGVYYLTARGWQLRRRFPDMVSGGQIDFSDLRDLGRLETGLLNALIALCLVFLSGYLWLDRYDMLLSDHGNLLVGMDYLQQHLGLPLQSLKAGAALLAALLVLARKRRLAMACIVAFVIDAVLPPLVGSLYVRPNELTLEKPFIERHLEATRSAYALDRRVRTQAFDAHKEARIDFAKNRSMLDNVRLWDWRAFHDTLSQSQPLRPFSYSDTDVDRYQIDGQMRQVLLAPRELDLTQLGDAGRRWINSNLTFTHGYGLVLAEASRITQAGLPELLIRDAPPEVLTKSLKLTRPEIYYGETPHEPVFVRTSQPEFNYPAGSGPSGTSDVSTTYNGRGGFSIGSPMTRLIAAIAYGDWNIVLSSALNPESRMMVRRKVPERLNELAEFITWDWIRTWSSLKRAIWCGWWMATR